MLMYMFINCTIILFSIIFLYKKNNKNLLNNIYLGVIGVLLLIIAGFRGDFAADYNGYANLFNYFNNFSFKEIFQTKFAQEIGYVLLNRIIGVFTKDSIYLMVITSLIIITLFFKEFKKYSRYIWLSVLMFVTVGSFYTSFNILRQILAVAIIFSGSKYLYDRNLTKFSCIVLLAASFHKSAIVMIFFYFILNYKFNMKNLLITLFALSVSMIYLERIICLIQNIFYAYYIDGSYGMTGFNYKNVVLPLAILLFVLLHSRKIDFENNRINIWVNAIVFYTFFSLLGLKVQMVQRMAEFFVPYALLLVPQIISEVTNKDMRRIYFFLSVLCLVAYNYFSLDGSPYAPFYFIWQVE